MQARSSGAGRVVVPPGPAGYLVRDVPLAEWKAFERQHGAEAVERAPRFLESRNGPEIEKRVLHEAGPDDDG
ncbi:MAG TPA: hypothetical protein VLA09_07140 [Longimicrobiales bacterium]|nr:hypothetical protein [Longimicrobiales bacterium]